MENARKRRVSIVAIRRDSRELKREIDESAEDGLGAAWLSVRRQRYNAHQVMTEPPVSVSGLSGSGSPRGLHCKVQMN